ncbi:hypothetical protein ACHAXS_007084 [Conticribra weissflogii]
MGSSDSSSRNQGPKPPINSSITAAAAATASTPPQINARAITSAQSSSILSGIGARSGLIAALSTTISKMRSPITNFPYASADVTREASARCRDNCSENGKPSESDQRHVASNVDPAAVEATGTEEPSTETDLATRSLLESEPSNTDNESTLKNLVTEKKASKKSNEATSSTRKKGDKGGTESEEVAKEIIIPPLDPNMPKSKSSHGTVKQPVKQTSLEKIQTSGDITATATSSSTSQSAETDGLDKSHSINKTVSVSAELAPPTVVTTKTSTLLAASATIKFDNNQNSSKSVSHNTENTKDDSKKDNNHNQMSHRDIAAAKWHENYKLLKDFQQKHGHCRVPRRYAVNPHFGTWVANQRSQYRTYVQMINGREKELKDHIDNNVRYNFMYDERYKLLQKLGFETKCKRGWRRSGNAGEDEGARSDIQKKNDIAGIEADEKNLKKKENGRNNAAASTDCKPQATKATVESKPSTTSALLKKQSSLSIENNDSERNESPTVETLINSNFHERRDRLRRERYEFLEAVGLKNIADKWGKKIYGFDPSLYDDDNVSSPPSSPLLSENDNKRKLLSLKTSSEDSPQNDCKKPRRSPEGDVFDIAGSVEHVATRTIRVFRILDIDTSDQPGDPPYLSFSSSVHRL